MGVDCPANLVRIGFKNRKNAHEHFVAHKQSESHRKATIEAKTCGQSLCVIDEYLKRQTQQVCNNWTSLLLRL